MKLFDIKPNEVRYSVIITTFKYNKVFNKILSALKKNSRYKIREINKWKGSLKEYEVAGVLAGTKAEFVEILKQDVIDIIPSEFPRNYSFDFRGVVQLGYMASFNIDKTNAVAHRITEVRGGASGNELPLQILK